MPNPPAVLERKTHTQRIPKELWVPAWASKGCRHQHKIPSRVRIHAHNFLIKHIKLLNSLAYGIRNLTHWIPFCCTIVNGWLAATHFVCNFPTCECDASLPTLLPHVELRHLFSSLPASVSALSGCCRFLLPSPSTTSSPSGSSMRSCADAGAGGLPPISGEGTGRGVEAPGGESETNDSDSPPSSSSYGGEFLEGMESSPWIRRLRRSVNTISNSMTACTNFITKGMNSFTIERYKNTGSSASWVSSLSLVAMVTSYGNGRNKTAWFSVLGQLMRQTRQSIVHSNLVCFCRSKQLDQNCTKSSTFATLAVWHCATYLITSMKLSVQRCAV